MIKNYVSQLKSEFQNYTGADCMKDLMAGLTVAAVALPLALAFGVSSGSTAAAGLVTAIIAGLVIGALSGGYYQISGPTGAMAAILISIIARYGMQGVVRGNCEDFPRVIYAFSHTMHLDSSEAAWEDF